MAILAVSLLRAVIEVALLALLGQAAVGLLAGANRHHNPVYQLFAMVARPAIRLIRLMTPAAIIDKHVPWVAFFVLFWLWIFLAWAKQILAT